MIDVKIISAEKLSNVLINFGVIIYEDLESAGIEVRVKGGKMDYYWHGERISFEQASELIYYHYITGSDAENYDEARKIVADYYRTR